MGVNFRSINKFTEIYCFRISQKKIVNVSEGYTNILFMGFSSPISKLINNNKNLPWIRSHVLHFKPQSLKHTYDPHMKRTTQLA